VPCISPRAAHAVIVGLVAVAFVLASAVVPESPWFYSSPAPEIKTIVGAGMVWYIRANEIESAGPFALTGHPTWTFSSTFSSTNSVAGYALSSSRFSAWGGPSSLLAEFCSTSGGVQGRAMNLRLPGGSYNLVWTTLNGTQSTSVDVLTNIVATATA